jgi:hypothetical protein
MALPGIQFGPGINIEQGVKMGTFQAEPTLLLNLDAATYAGSGPWIDSVSSMPFTLYNSPTWSSTIGGGSFLFVAGSSQYAESNTGVGSINNWSVEVWHFYTGTNTSGSPCIVTEEWPNPASQINFSLGSVTDNSPDVQAGLFNAGWYATPNGYTLSPNNWYQIVGTYDGVNIKLYVNGSMVNSVPCDVLAGSGNLGIKLMKRWDASATQYWGGRLASVRIWNGDINFEGVRGSWLADKARYGL